jgi:integrase
MKAKKTATGQWTCQAYYKDAEGKVHRPRFTAARKSDAERMASAFSLEHKDDYKLAKTGNLPITFGEAANRYIRNREAILSPSTVREYYRALNRSYESILEVNIHDITRETIQQLVNDWASYLNPKTVRNLHGFLSSVMKAYRPDFILNTTMPQKIKPILYTPADHEVKKLIEFVKETRLEIPVILAALSSLRRSEICALTTDDIGDGWIHVHNALVQDKNKKWVLKTTKTEAGTRITYLPKQATDRIRTLSPDSGRIVAMNPNMITSSFAHVLKRTNLHKFRFHDLRSYYASILHYLQVPDKYIMQWGGWHDEKTLQEHYQRVMQDKIPDMAIIGINHFDRILQ